MTNSHFKYSPQNSKYPDVHRAKKRQANYGPAYYYSHCIFGGVAQAALFRIRSCGNGKGEQIQEDQSMRPFLQGTKKNRDGVNACGCFCFCVL